MEVHVIRHTRVEVRAGICYGQTDVEPTATFETEARKLKNKLPTSFDLVYSSPLRRCILLAQEFSGQVVSDNRLKEMHFGQWELKPWNEIPESQITPWYRDFVNTLTPEGENFRAVYGRVQEFMEDLRKNADNQKVLIVCHGGVIRSIWCYLLGIPLENAFKIPVEFGEILRFHLGKSAVDDYIIQKK